MAVSAELNERMTRIGPGTPAGEMMRRYWHPIAASSELLEQPVKKVRLLGEDLALYRGGDGQLGLLAEQCPHRAASLAYGMPEESGLRCPYHGWLFDRVGQCIEQPAEPAESKFCDRITTTAYRVEELGGLVFAYLGPDEPPLLPRFDLLVRQGVVRSIGIGVVPCNWLQIMENSVDPVHVEWLHGKYFDYINDRYGQERLDLFAGSSSRHVEIGFDVFDYGIIKRRVLEGSTKADELWAVGHPVVFPNFVKVGGGGVSEFQYRVPMDDTNTLHIWYTLFDPPGGVAEEQQTVPYFNVPTYDSDGKFILDFLPGQDMMAWITQGAIADRTQEHIGRSDRGIVLLRRVLQEQIRRVELGQDPMGTVRDPARNVVIDLPLEKDRFKGGVHALKELRGKQSRYSPYFDELVGLFEGAVPSGT